MLGLVVIHDEAGVNHAGNPAEQGEENAQDKTEDAAGHEDGDWREDDTKKVAESFQRQ
jgi:hypothetical protein